MTTLSLTKLVSPIVLKKLLEALRRLKPIPDHPWLDLMVVQRHRAAWDAIITPQQALYDVLIDLLTTEFDKVRTIHHFPPVNPDWSVGEVQTDLRQLGMCLNERLLASSVAYYRYGRSDLGLGIGEIVTYLGHDDRNLRRFVNDFWRYLCRVILRLEGAARREARDLHCQLALPRWRLIKLPDQDAQAASLARRVVTIDPAGLLIYGPPGIGKTVLALRVAHHLIEQRAMADVAWLNPTEILADGSPSISRLASHLCQGLGLATEAEPVNTLTRYVHQRCAQGERLLIILDSVTRWQAAIQGLWSVLGHCVVIVTAQHKLHGWHGLAVTCPVFSEADAALVLRFWDEERRHTTGWLDCEDVYARLIGIGQGNPRRLKRAYQCWHDLHVVPAYSPLDTHYRMPVT